MFTWVTPSLSFFRSLSFLRGGQTINIGIEAPSGVGVCEFCEDPLFSTLPLPHPRRQRGKWHSPLSHICLARTLSLSLFCETIWRNDLQTFSLSLNAKRFRHCVSKIKLTKIVNIATNCEHCKVKAFCSKNKARKKNFYNAEAIKRELRRPEASILVHRLDCDGPLQHTRQDVALVRHLQVHHGQLPLLPQKHSALAKFTSPQSQL